MKHFFANKTARNTFFLMIIGFIALLLATVFLINNSHRIKLRHFSSEQRANQVIRVVHRLQKRKQYAMPFILNAPDMRARVDLHPWKGATTVKHFTPAKIHQLFQKNKKVKEIAIQLPNKHWLNLFLWVPTPVIVFMVLFLFSGILLFALLIILCIWIVKRLTDPLMEFSEAIQSLNIDVEAPTLAEHGSEETKAMIRAFNQIQTKMRKLVTDRTQMLAAISHDLRTPITRLKLRAEYLEDKSQYEKILADLNEMEQMINAVLVFSKEDSKNELKERFDLNALLESLCDEMIDTGLDVVYIGSEKRVPYFGRITSLKRALMNLIDNAVKYGKTAKVMLNVKHDHITIDIEDKGPGLPANEIEKVFEPFYRVEQSRSRKTGGTGLGLVVAKDTVRAHNGEISLMNLPKGGLRVSIRLPLT